MKSFFIFIVLLIQMEAFAEGLSRDKYGQPNAEMQKMALTESQKEILNNHRYIKLTGEQFSKVGDLISDTILKVFTEHYSDCTCQQIYGIWFHPDSIGIPTYLSAYKQWEQDGLESLETEHDTLAVIQYKAGMMQHHLMRQSLAMHRFDDSLSQVISFFMNASGEIFYRKKKISIDVALAKIEELNDYFYQNKEEDEDVQTIYFILPPIHQNENKKNVLYMKYILESSGNASNIIYQ